MQRLLIEVCICDLSGRILIVEAVGEHIDKNRDEHDSSLYATTGYSGFSGRSNWLHLIVPILVPDIEEGLSAERAGVPRLRLADYVPSTIS